MKDTNTQSIEIPDQMLRGWQQTVDLIAELSAIPASLIMRIHPHEIEVFASSQTEGNPYEQHEMAELGNGLYCETVVNTCAELLVADALADPDWDNNPDIKLGMISYCGLPLNWPDETPFGTICMLDSRENRYSPRSRQLLERFQSSIEADLATLYQQRKLEHANEKLEQRVRQRTQQLERLNQQLCREIDHRTSIERTLAYNREFDALTGIANRFSLVDYLTHQLQRHTDGDAAEETAVLYIGVRNFKSINDSYGYVVGDKVLLEIASRLCKSLAAEHFVARTTGDEFAVVISAEAVTDQALQLQQQLFQALAPVISIYGHGISLLLNAGVAVAPSDSDDAAALIQKASAAMSASKEQEQSCCLYNAGTLSAIEDRYQLETHLVDALKNHQMALHYQPLICTRTKQVLGAEALLRWHHPELGNIPPDRFIPLAERNGQIIEIGNFVLRQAIEQAVQWQAMARFPLRIAINISPVQFRDGQLVGHIQQLLQCYRLDPELLELEITEGVLLQAEHQAEQRLLELRRLGLRVSLDDFGTGYSSLSYLQRYAFDTLKIDRSFISNLENSARDKELVRGILAFARSLNLHVVAEGVETPAQDHFLAAEQCECGQGYLYGKPMPAAQFTAQFLSCGPEDLAG
ncbi:bifunctional diguanylate cyclase/phosphodiesterase [Marinobacterium jannaschii]|uniref:bifunctional diguanylate cyclase/phosphodiesterase n=1 Tax=Marinobacterium jannaschii TaxID=64970 RepID=UPI000AD5FFC2|nr:EAL domain-containing protein [Marinobacterium jannaschii]